jgi:hypothetical protein
MLQQNFSTPITTRRERRQSSKELTVSTWHNGTFGVWPWSDLSEQEKREFEESRKRAMYVQTFGIYA